MRNKGESIEVYRLIAKLSKRDTIKLSRMTCKKHYHSYLVHPQCAFNDGILITTNNGKTIQLKEKIGFVDIETAGLQADFHYIFSYCIKELDGKVYKRLLTPKEVRNRKIRDKLLMKQFCKDVEQFTRVVTYYGSGFDLPFLRTRAIFWGLDFPIYKSIYTTDVYYIIKHKFRLHRNRMETACRTFGIPCKTHPINPEIWQDAMTGDKKALQYILEHNVEDVISLELLWKKVNQYALENKRSI
jgi:uncharacterized protein YprB with RNaseH-like and TPR domain